MTEKTKIRVLMVCMGNICRSPLAHGLFEHLVREQALEDRIEVDSAGTHAFHVGERPDPRSQKTAQRRDVDISSQRARRVDETDFERFDYILAMDRDNYRILIDACPSGQQHKIRMFLEFAQDLAESEVPDPYYGGPSGFERVFDLIEAAAHGLLDHIHRAHLETKR